MSPASIVTTRANGCYRVFLSPRARASLGSSLRAAFYRPGDCPAAEMLTLSLAAWDVSYWNNQYAQGEEFRAEIHEALSSAWSQLVRVVPTIALSEEQARLLHRYFHHDHVDQELERPKILVDSSDSALLTYTAAQRLHSVVEAARHAAGECPAHSMDELEVLARHISELDGHYSENDGDAEAFTQPHLEMYWSSFCAQATQLSDDQAQTLHGILPHAQHGVVPPAGAAPEGTWQGAPN